MVPICFHTQRIRTCGSFMRNRNFHARLYGCLNPQSHLMTRSQRQTFFTSSKALTCQHAKSCEKKQTPPGPTTIPFWTSSSTWKRASVNTLRCLVGCTLGDFSALWFLQSFYPDMGVGPIMAASSTHHPPGQAKLSKFRLTCLRLSKWSPASHPRCSSKPSFCASAATASPGRQQRRRQRG